jgi:hypothetical protein
MTWTVLITDEYEHWFLSLTNDEQIDVLAMVDILEIKGPQLSRPYADTLQGTKKVRNLKELRIQHAGKPYRVFYAFDPKRNAILLCGGRKDGSGDKQFYQQMIPIAEREFLNYLRNDDLNKRS